MQKATEFAKKISIALCAKIDRYGSIKIRNHQQTPAGCPARGGVSIFTTGLYAVETIEETILSVVEQTYTNIEFIVMEMPPFDSNMEKTDLELLFKGQKLLTKEIADLEERLLIYKQNLAEVRATVNTHKYESAG